MCALTSDSLSCLLWLLTHLQTMKALCSHLSASHSTAQCRTTSTTRTWTWCTRTSPLFSSSTIRLRPTKIFPVVWGFVFVLEFRTHCSSSVCTLYTYCNWVLLLLTVLSWVRNVNTVRRRQRDPDQVLVRRHVRHGAPEPAAAARLPTLHERRALAAQPQSDARDAHFRRAPAPADHRHCPRRTAATVRAAAAAAAAAARGRHRRVARHAGAAACVTGADERRAAAANVAPTSFFSSCLLCHSTVLLLRGLRTRFTSLSITPVLACTCSRSALVYFLFRDSVPITPLLIVQSVTWDLQSTRDHSQLWELTLRIRYAQMECAPEEV